MDSETADRLNRETETLSAQELLIWTLEHFGTGNVALASSFGAEDQVITGMLVKADPKARVFTLDTGRLPQETYEVMVETRTRYGIAVDVAFPDTALVEEMVREHGPNLFYESVEKRKLCCGTRKVVPLKRKLSGLKAWICGLRRDQSITRTAAQRIEWDEANGLYKVNPLVDWSGESVWRYIKENDVPYNRLHDKGYPSIGCAPCTRCVQPGEDARAGRWWWEEPEHKECGLHIKDRRNG